MPCRASDRQIRDIHDFLKGHCGEPVVVVKSRNWPTPQRSTIEDALTRTGWGRIKSILMVTPTVRLALVDAAGATVHVSWTAEQEQVGLRVLGAAREWRKWWLLGGYPETLLLVFLLILASFSYAGHREAAHDAELEQAAAREQSTRTAKEIEEARLRELVEEARRRGGVGSGAPEPSPSSGLPWWATALILGGMYAIVVSTSPPALTALWFAALPFTLLHHFLGKVFPAFWFDIPSAPNAYWGGKVARTIGALILVGALALAVYEALAAP